MLRLERQRMSIDAFPFFYESWPDGLTRQYQILGTNSVSNIYKNLILGGKGLKVNIELR